jgi:hypothetical protein
MPEAAESHARSRPSPVYWIFSLALAGVLLYYSLRGIDWRTVWSVIEGANLLGITAALAIMSTALFLRSWRWRVLLSAELGISFAEVFWATAAGYLGNNFLPARAGEFVRTVMISRRTGLSKTFVLTTALCERVVDALALIIIASAVLLVLPENPGWFNDAAEPLAIAGIVGVVVLSLFPLFEPSWERVLARLPIPERFRERAEHFLRQGVQGLRSFHDRRRLAKYLALTSVIWFLDGAIVVVGSNAIAVPIPLTVAFLLIAGLGLSSALPSTPGYVGIYQFAAVTILTPFGFTQEAAIAFILLFQAMSYVVFLFWGAIGIWINSRFSPSATPLAHSD